MKGIFQGLIPAGFWFSLFFLMACPTGKAQQNTTQFFMYSLPETNFINPALQGKCGTFIGLPVLSSFHMNVANSGFTANDVMTLYTDNTIDRKFDYNTDRIRGLNYFLSEFHSTLLAVGLQRNDLYYSFTVIEKDHGAGLYTNNMVAFSLRGGNEFEGQEVNLKGTNFSYNHYREFAFGISKRYSDRLLLGFKAKLLFGIFNLTTGNSSFGIFIDGNSDNILLDIDGGYNSSLPYSLRMEDPGTYRFYKRYDAPMTSHLSNFSNPGIGLDLGFIYRYSDRMTLSGSLLDLGMVFYRSNLTNYSLEGDLSYYGPFGSGGLNEGQLWSVFDAMNQQMNEEVTHNAYTYFLDPKLYLGAAYKLNQRFDLNFLLYNRLLPRKLQTGATVSLLTRPAEKLEASISWSYINRSAANLGFGVSYGDKPMQVYLVSDNLLGFVLPLNTKNVNIRAGINLYFGCKSRFNINDCGCDWMKDAESHRLRKESARRNRKSKGY